jgi:hypothetical protein
VSFFCMNRSTVSKRAACSSPFPEQIIEK